MSMLGYLMTLPSTTTLITSMGNYSTVFIDELLPLALMFAGIMFGILVIKWVATLFHR